ncbi:hypothetical protein H6P81_015461 [Aristolochia fimbriata]|uniref:Uncharacterized protein n=1 Tax=Aristolochia fimbriata TaxID=158543 RepID=A0AAV7E8I9_ARIFI|nr:hypothetical protein H6P81_015461 [Aristolochia fimbriata]
MAFCSSNVKLQSSFNTSMDCLMRTNVTRHWNHNENICLLGSEGSRRISLKKAGLSFSFGIIRCDIRENKLPCYTNQKLEAGTTDLANSVLQDGFDASQVTDTVVPKMETCSNFDKQVGDDPKVDHGAGNGDSFNGSGGTGKFPPGGGGGGDDHGEEDKEEEEFGPLLKYDEVITEAEARGVILPLDMLDAAKKIGIRKVLLSRYLDLQASGWPLGIAVRSCSLLRNRMLADPAFLFKIGTEIVIDTCCATFAEVQKRGKDFWAEFELYLADVLVGVVVNIALVGLLAPYARFGHPTASKGFFGRIQHTCAALPSSVFEAERPGCRFSVQQRIGTYFYKGLLYTGVGFFCGIIGQGIANLIMTAKRSIKKSEEDIPVPPLVKSAALWGVFLGVSSNTRYQIINGLEQLVEASPVAKRVPPVAMAFTVGVRFANNIYGGMQFVDWARWSGVQ